MSRQVTAPPTDRILRAPAAAEVLGISKSTVWRYARLGKLNPVKLSERVTRFRQSEVQALIAGAAK